MTEQRLTSAPTSTYISLQDLFTIVVNDGDTPVYGNVAWDGQGNADAMTCKRTFQLYNIYTYSSHGLLISPGPKHQSAIVLFYPGHVDQNTERPLLDA